MPSTSFSGFEPLPQVGNDPTVVTFPGPEGTGLGADLSGMEASASDNSSDGIFGTVEFDSSWMGDGIDWVSLHVLLQAKAFSRKKKSKKKDAA